MPVDPRTQLQPVTMKGVRIIFRNFKGEPGEFNKEGTRTFGVILPDDLGEVMLNDGWNVKRLKPNEEEQEEGIDHGPAWLPVEAAYDKGRPPKIVVISSRGPTTMTEQIVEEIDNVDIAVDDSTGLPKCDMIVRPYFWSNAMGKSGVKAYLKTMYVTIEEDELERDYAELGEPQ